MQNLENKIYFGYTSAEDLINKFGSPLMVYEEWTLKSKQDLRNSIDYSPKKILYACKANTNPSIIDYLIKSKIIDGIDAVSPGEVFISKKLGIKDILYTGNNTTDEEMNWLINEEVALNIDSLSQLERYGKLKNQNKSPEICVRINPDVGDGHHDHCITGGPDSKFGIYFDKTDEIKKISKKYGLKIKGLHEHIGSGIRDINKYKKAMKVLFKTAKEFKDLEFIDFGGGIGVPYAPEDNKLDINKFGSEISDLFSGFCKSYGQNLTLMIEPGRYFVAEAGTLLTRVNTLKETPKHKFAGTDSGFNHLIRHAMYKSYHAILNASNVHGLKEHYAVAGNLCESGDLFSHGRDISKITEGDILAITHAGAYGYSMSSNYNSRLRPAEVIIHSNGGISLIRKREVFSDLLRGTNLK